MKSLQFYLTEAKSYAGENHFNADGSTFALTPPSELPWQYNQLRQKLVRQNLQNKVVQMPRNWSNAIFEQRTKEPKGIVKPRSLRLENLNTLSRDRYVVPDLLSDHLAHFPLKTLGGAYYQYMCHGKFYEFDKNPMLPDSDIKWLLRLLRQTHDFYHLVTEIYHYGWDGGFVVYDDPQCYKRDLLVLLEEMCIHAFILGQVRLKAVIPIMAEWANSAIFDCSQWLTEAYPLWRRTQSYEIVKKRFRFASFIADCEKWMYASFKLGRLEAQINIDEYLEELDSVLEPLPSTAPLEAQEYREMMLESFERGLRSKPLVCFQWDRYLGNTLRDVREFLNIPRRKRFKDGSHYLDADLY